MSHKQEISTKNSYEMDPMKKNNDEPCTRLEGCKNGYIFITLGF